MSEQQKSIREQTRALHEKLSAAIDDLHHMQKQYRSDPDLQVRLGFLEYWFPDTISKFGEWSDQLQQAIDNEEYRNSQSFSSTLGSFRSLGQALDADTTWSERDEPLHVKSGEMINLSKAIRSNLRDASRDEQDV